MVSASAASGFAVAVKVAENRLFACREHGLVGIGDAVICYRRENFDFSLGKWGDQISRNFGLLFVLGKECDLEPSGSEAARRVSGFPISPARTEEENFTDGFLTLTEKVPP